MIEEFIKGGAVQLDGYEPDEISQAKTPYYGFYNWFANNNVKFFRYRNEISFRRISIWWNI